MTIRCRPWRLALLSTLLLAGCAGAPKQYSVKEVYVCAAEDCGVASRKYSAGRMAAAIRELLALNQGQGAEICDSDPKERNCASVGLCHFVQGGPFPGMGCARSIVFNEATLGDQAGQVAIKADMTRTFLGIQLGCATMSGAISVRSADEISLEVAPHYCNWAGIGNMTATFNVAIESVDLDRGQIGGYWQHAVAGTGVGSGSGYAILKFPKGMPPGADWIGARE